jgi:hypothetical protein
MWIDKEQNSKIIIFSLNILIIVPHRFNRREQINLKNNGKSHTLERESEYTERRLTTKEVNEHAGSNAAKTR